MKINRMICLSWYGGVDSQDCVARQVSAVYRTDVSGLWLCVEKQGQAPEDTKLIQLKLDQKTELNTSLRFFDDCLIPLFMHLRKTFSFNKEHYLAYRRWNKGLAEGIASLIKDGDVLWLHDAHWIPLARYLKALKPDLPIGISFNTSFCSSETLRTLPVASELLDDLFYFDLVTFTRPEDIRSFTDSMEHILSATMLADKRLKKGNLFVKTAAYHPVEMISDEVFGAHVGALSLSPSDKLILSVDSPDWFVNKAFRDRGYESFLNENPTLMRDTVFGSLVTSFAKDKSRLEHQIEKWTSDAEDLNDHWRMLSRKPFRQIQTDNYQVVRGAMRAAKVFVDVSTGSYGSLNYWSFWRNQNPDDPGVLIVSSLVASEEILPGAILVHPLDVLGLSEALKQAMLMPLSERKRRYDQLSASLNPITTERRCSAFIYDVVEQARRNKSQVRMAATRSLVEVH